MRVLHILHSKLCIDSNHLHLQIAYYHELTSANVEAAVILTTIANIRDVVYELIKLPKE